MNATHDDWKYAKKRRDDAAVMIAYYYINGSAEKLAKRSVEAFTAADEEMKRIAKELDGRGDK